MRVGPAWSKDRQMTPREILLKIFSKALKAVAPANLIGAAVQLDGDRLFVGGRSYELRKGRGVHVFGSGKASVGSAAAVEKILGGRAAGGLIISNEPGPAAGKIEIFASSHPVPTDRSVRAAEMLMHRLGGLAEDDFFVYLLSGGTSSLVEKPFPPVTLNDLRQTYDLLLRASVPIEEMNVVRKHLSLVKGGRLAGSTKAKGVVLVISDVIGDRLEVIGSAPLLFDRSSYGEAQEILLRHGVWQQAPETVRTLITQGIAGTVPETPKEPNPEIDHVLIGNNLKLLRAGKQEAEALGVHACIMSSRLRGEAREVSRAIIAIGEEILATGNPFKPPLCLLFGGETTVSVKGAGKGGRNQEMCLAALGEIRETKNLFFLSAGSDGIDGRSNAAGAVVDCTSYEKARGLRLNIGDYLNRNDSYEFFRQTGDLIVTGPTGTNVMDMTVLLVGGTARL